MPRTFVCLALVALAGCAPRFDGRVYRGNGVAFAVATIPPSWQPLRDRDAALEFRDPDARATVLVNGRCGLASDEVPLSALTQHLFIDFTQRSLESQEVVPLDGREAMHTRLTALLDGVPMRFDVWVLKKDGCVYDLLYFAPPTSFDGGLPAFGELVRGFTTAVPGE
ncbi:MAG: hypothetical protein FJ096_20120 [Deltaproteobacteria bacterium]|nr:hypothetical protein [Deltaproteobacteria bacterium]